MKFSKRGMIFTGLIALFSTAFSQTTLVEKVETKPGETKIGYEKYKLANGLTIIIHEDHSDPVATVMVTYKVGSDRESVGKSGFAHFFEHMMFEGSKHVANHEDFKIISTAGGQMNGNTTSDRTQYFNNIPSNQVEVALWLEADRMGYLLDSLTEKKFENQRATVKNEKFQNQENRPYGMVDEIMGQTLYPFKHPYSWPTIGYVDDLNRATLNDVKNFFLRWYGPNNAILTISGDVNVKQTLEWVEKYFGIIKAGPDVKRLVVAPVSLPENKYSKYYDKVYLPLTVMNYPTRKAYHKDEPALDFLAAMMGDGNNSLFYKNFVKTEKAAEASVSHSTRELAGEFSIAIAAYPPDDAYENATAYDKMFKELEEKAKSTIEEFEKTGITEEALARVKAKKEAGIISGEESAYGKAELLSNWAYMLDRPFNINDELDRYNKVTLNDIKEVFNRYIKGAGAAVVNVYPQMNSKDSVKSFNPNAGLENKEDKEYAGLTFTPLQDGPGVWKKPTPQPAKMAKVPDFYTGKLNNGLKYIGTKNEETPMVTLIMSIEGGSLVMTTEEQKKLGVSSLVADMLNEGTEKYTSEQVSAELDKLGSTISFYSDKTKTQVYVTTLSKNLDATLKLLEEKLFHPKFDEKDFKRVKKQFKENLAQQKIEPNYAAGVTANSILYGNSVWGLHPTKRNIEKIELEDVKNYYNKYYAPELASLIVVGNVDQKDIEPKLAFLNQWKPKGLSIHAEVKEEAVEPMIYVVDKQAASSSVILMDQTSLKFDAIGDYFKNQIADYMLGGNFNSRLNLNLREEKGYTYGIRSSFYGDQYKGNFLISASVKRRETGNSLVEILKEYTNYLKNGVSDEDVEFTKNSILNSQATLYETSYQKAFFLAELLQYNLPKEFPDQQITALKSMTKVDFNAQIQKSMHSERTIFVIVGDKVAIQKQLEKLTYNSKDFSPKFNIKKIKVVEVD